MRGLLRIMRGRQRQRGDFVVRKRADDACRGEDVTKISVVSDKIPSLQHRQRVVEIGPTFASLLESISAASRP